ncbi:MAG: SsrA-binding protein SmpB [Bacteroidota bacterium]|jgi:SsrA-binding protein
MKPEGIQDRHQKIIVKNRKAYHEYEVISSVETGIVLRGTEVKSLRAGKCSIQDAYANFPNPQGYELFLINFHISPYEHGNRENHEPKRARKLLVNYRESVKLKSAVQEKGITLIPLTIYFSGPFVKIELGLMKAKRKYDKRQVVKERDTERDIRRNFKA